MNQNILFTISKLNSGNERIFQNLKIIKPILELPSPPTTSINSAITAYKSITNTNLHSTISNFQEIFDSPWYINAINVSSAFSQHLTQFSEPIQEILRNPIYQKAIIINSAFAQNLAQLEASLTPLRVLTPIINSTLLNNFITETNIHSSISELSPEDIKGELRQITSEEILKYNEQISYILDVYNQDLSLIQKGLAFLPGIIFACIMLYLEYQYKMLSYISDIASEVVPQFLQDNEVKGTVISIATGEYLRRNISNKMNIRNLKNILFPDEIIANKNDLKFFRFITKDNLAIYENSNKKSRKYARLKFGTVVHIISEKKDWSSIRYYDNNKNLNDGWVYSRYLGKFKVLS